MARDFGVTIGRRFIGIATLASFCLLACSASSAQAATDSLFAAPSVAGTGDCSSPANACILLTAVTNANAEPVADSVQIKLARGVYLLKEPTPTALTVTFAGPSLTFEAERGTPILNGGRAARLLEVGATSNVTINGLALEFAMSAGNSGAIENKGTLTVRNSTFSSNVAGNGGGIGNAVGATLSVADSTFSHNSATSVGGGAIINFGTATVARSAIVDNTAGINGGGINTQPTATMTLSNSTIAGNTSGSQGGGYVNLGTSFVETSTFANNSAGPSIGSAIVNGSAEKLTLAGNIIAAQSSPTACNPPPSEPSIVDAGYNLDTDGTCVSPTSPATGSHSGTTAYGSSTYGTVLDSYLATSLAGNGGPTPTIALLNTPNPLTTLANPALDVVPPSFNLPSPVGGVSAACALPDQRGIVPAAGGNCDVGAYLLQATKTALSQSTKAGEKSVTYTATVTPAPNGGTVAFNDGAGNPATTQCTAQTLSSGKATCTVTYSKKAVYSVTAIYSGDGATNDFAASTSAAISVDRVPPSAPKKLKGKIKKTKLQLSWGGSKDNVAIKQYQVLRNGKKVKSTKAKTRSATLKLSGNGGAYTVVALDAAGNVSAPSKKLTVRPVPGNKKAFRIAK